MYMVRHHKGSPESHLLAVFMEAMFQNKIARQGRQFPAEISVKRDEMFPPTFLDVRKIAAIVVLSLFQKAQSFLYDGAPTPALFLDCRLKRNSNTAGGGCATQFSKILTRS